MVETIFMALALVLLIYTAYISHKTYVTTQITLVGLVTFLQSLEEEEDYGETQRLH
jgi:hypothetical protein